MKIATKCAWFWLLVATLVGWFWTSTPREAALYVLGGLMYAYRSRRQPDFGAGSFVLLWAVLLAGPRPVQDPSDDLPRARLVRS